MFVKNSLLAFAMISTLTSLSAISFAHDGHKHAAAARPRAVKKTCPVVGIKATKQFILKRDYSCYKKRDQVTSLGYLPAAVRRAAKSNSSSSSVPNISAECKFLAVGVLETYFAKSKLRCFASKAAARKAKYTRLALPTPTPTPSPTATFPPGFEPSIPTPTPLPTGTILPDKGVINYTFNLTAQEQGSSYSGTCTAILNNTHSILDVSCDHNVIGATEAHLHVVPENGKSCEVVNPGAHFDLHCLLNADQSIGIEEGRGLVGIHLSPGGSGLVAAGYVRN